MNATIAATVNGLLAGRGLKNDDVATRLGISGATLHRRRNNESDFTAAEVAELVDIFDLSSVEDLYSGLDGRLVPTPPPGGVGYTGDIGGYPRPGWGDVLPFLTPRKPIIRAA